MGVRRRTRAFIGTFAAVMLAAAIGASSASATFHLIKVREVAPGTGSQDSYVEVQMYAPFQNFLSNGAGLAVCNNICSLVPATYGPFSNVPNGDSQDTVLFGDSGIPVGSKDFDVDLNLDGIQAGGAVCYLSEPGFNDCVSWGNFSNNAALSSNYGSSANPGTPAAVLSSGMALRRSIAPGCPTALESADDTNNSAADFAPATPQPRKNSVAPTETPCAGGGPAGYPAGPTYPGAKKKCKKQKKKTGAYPAKKKKCKKKKRK
jgi:hypothetical protein